MNFEWISEWISEWLSNEFQASWKSKKHDLEQQKNKKNKKQQNNNKKQKNKKNTKKQKHKKTTKTTKKQEEGRLGGEVGGEGILIALWLRFLLLSPLIIHLGLKSWVQKLKNPNRLWQLPITWVV